jgi:hypothetical protein
MHGTGRVGTDGLATGAGGGGATDGGGGGAGGAGVQASRQRSKHQHPDLITIVNARQRGRAAVAA